MIRADAKLLDTRLFKWFAPPTLATPELTRKARALWIAAWPFFAVVFIVLALAVAVEPTTLGRRAISVGATGLLVALLHELNRRGRTLIASWVLVLGLTLLVTQRAWGTGGVHAPVGVFYALFIIMAGALLGQRAGLKTAIVCFAGASFLAIAEQRGALVTSDPRGPLPSYVFVILTIGLALVVQRLFVQTPAEEQTTPRQEIEMLVHDLRSPLTVLLAQLQLLRNEVPARLSDDVNIAIGGAERLHRMTTGLLDVSRLESTCAPVKPALTNLTALTRGVVSFMRALDPDREIEMIGDFAVMWRCDEDVMRRVVENLVSNAIKHSPPRKPIRVSVMSVPCGVRIAVADQGRGVPAEARERIFEKFGAASLRSETGFDSTGLGLAFCKLAVESHGGRIWVEDGAPRGSVFIVELPA
ncbi:MAG TPA: HAMP domain-containing sensor histidine kinase [Gemmatimonadaceae bacterium]|nr:HAMP domain-containing sensor histidine kinase [Gemmatimonadaceae bacterium]